MNEDELRRLVNSAGYLFQLRVEEEIQSDPRSSWIVDSTEHRWVDPSTGDDGYIDLVASAGSVRVVIEAKKQEASRMVFLTPAPEGKEANTHKRARILWTHKLGGSKNLADYTEAIVAPFTPESAFCIAEQRKADERLLERTAGALLRSVESLAEQHLDRPPDRQRGELWLYLPLIVTTAQLFTCTFDPREVDLASGALRGGSFKPADAVRFRKTLPSRIAAYEVGRNAREDNALAERSVFIVSSSHLTEFMHQLGVIGNPDSPLLPWNQLRAAGH